MNLADASRTMWTALLSASPEDLERLEVWPHLTSLEREGAAHLCACAQPLSPVDPYCVLNAHPHMRRDPTRIVIHTDPLTLAGRAGEANVRRALSTPERYSAWLVLASHSAHLGAYALQDPVLLDTIHTPHTPSLSGVAFDPNHPIDDPKGLQTWKMRQLAQAFWNEAVLGLSVEETTRHVSAIARGVLESAVCWTQRRQEFDEHWPRTLSGKRVAFCVMALGKLGGEELNFGSDVDLVFVYETDQATFPTPTSNPYASVHSFFTAYTRALSALIDDKTHARLWRLDMRLRPDGARGPLAMSLSATVSWYETWGRTFERAVWLKGAPVAGSRDLGERLMERLQPFVYRRNLGTRALGELLEMKERIERHVSRKPVRWAAVSRSKTEDLEGWDVKTGRGGIRDIEFTAQALQLVYGGRRTELRSPTTLHAIARLQVAGLLPARDAQRMIESYHFYRKIEHLVQMESGQHTHRLPRSQDALQALAARLGWDFASWVDAVRASQSHVHTMFQRLLGEQTQSEDDPVWSAALQLLDQDDFDDTNPHIGPIFSALNLSKTPQVVRALRALRTHPSSPFRPHAPNASPAVRLLCAAARSAQPDVCLCNMQRVITHPSFHPTHLRAWTATAAIVTLSANVFGSSVLFSELLIRHPTHLKALLGPPPLHEEWSKSLLAQRLDGLVAPVQDRPQEILETLRYFKHRWMLRIALAWFAGLIGHEAMCARLSDLAELMMRSVCRVVYQDLIDSYGYPQRRDGKGESAYTVLALGKLGSGELGLVSDLDVVFLYEEAGQTDGESSISNAVFFSRFARRVINGLSGLLRNGRLYEVDTRLRPNGNQGTLVGTLDAFCTYHASARSSIFERLALVRARPIVGCRAFQDRVRGVLRMCTIGRTSQQESLCVDREGFACPDRLGEREPKHAAARISSLFQQIHAAHHPKRGLSVKFARGGLVHIELFAQALLWIFAPHRPALALCVEETFGNTLATLRESQQSGIIAANHCADLCTFYTRLRTLEQTLAHALGRATHTLPLDRPEAMDHLQRAAATFSTQPSEPLRQTLPAMMQRSATLLDALFASLHSLPTLRSEQLSSALPLTPHLLDSAP